MRAHLFFAAALLALMLGGCAPPPPSADSAAEVEAESSSPELQPLEYPRWETAPPGGFREYNQRANLIQRGHDVYLKHCVGCHGESGDGRGPAAARLITRPRDFRSGVFKFRSTDSGSLPLETDLYRTIDRGLARVSMPSFRLVPEGEKLAVIEYVKAFYPGWDAEKDSRRLVQIPLAPGDLDTAQRVRRGRVVYGQMECWKCHGTDGQGAGATQLQYTDAWGDPQRPFNFTRGSLKAGDAPQDVYRTFHTGLRSVMPSYGGETLALVAADGIDALRDVLPPSEVADLEAARPDFLPTAAMILQLPESERAQLTERNSWDLVAYIRSLRQVTSTAAAVLGPNASTSE